MEELAAFDAKTWSAFVDAMRPGVAASKTVEDGAQIVCERLSTGVRNVALARIYAIVPYHELPADIRVFVDRLAATAGVPELAPTTPVLTLLGTHGAKSDWCDRRRSTGHKGIPLVSAAFVEAIPMLSRLLKELGVDLAWLDAAPGVFTRRLVGGFNGVFHADDARSARDASGRLVIPATEFVATEGIRTVFGMGGANPDGTTLACIVFTRELLSRAACDRFTSLISMLKVETFSSVLNRRLFSAPPPAQ